MSEETDEEKFNELLEGFNKLKFNEITNPTFLEIMKHPDRETVWSNILVFYFDPKREHKLDDLMLKSFFEALGENIEITNFNAIKVWPEFPTPNHKRIDLVIEADNFVIGIENKVNHLCNNPFEDYANKIDDIANGRRKFKVVLSKNHYHEVNGFVNLTYESFIKSIKKNLPDYKDNANPKYLVFFKDFLRNIKNAIKFNEMIEDNEVFSYFNGNYCEIKKISTRFVKFKEEIENKFRVIHGAIDLSKICAIKGDIEPLETVNETGDSDRFLIFRIFIGNENEVNYDVYIEEKPLKIYCYALSDSGIYQKSIAGFDSFELDFQFSEDTKVVANKIANRIEEIIEKVLIN